MKTYWLIAFLTLFANATLIGKEPISVPLHPTLVFAESNGTRYQVIAADKDKPVVMIDGKRTSLPSETTLLTERAPGYAGMSATFRNEQFKGRQLTAGPKRMPDYLDEVTTEIIAAQDLSDCFLVIIHFEEEFLMSEEERAASRKKNAEIFSDRPVAKPKIRVQQIGNLKANEPSTVTFSSVLSLDTRSTNLPPEVQISFKTSMLYLLFSEGLEVKSPQSTASSAFLYHREKLIHSLLVQRWLKQNAKADQPLNPVLQIPPLLDATEGVPSGATATMTIAPDGTVTAVSLDREFPAAAATLVQTTLRAWLFLPKLKAGVPVESRVRVPLQF